MRRCTLTCVKLIGLIESYKNKCLVFRSKSLYSLCGYLSFVAALKKSIQLFNAIHIYIFVFNRSDLSKKKILIKLLQFFVQNVLDWDRSRSLHVSGNWHRARWERQGGVCLRNR